MRCLALLRTRADTDSDSDSDRFRYSRTHSRVCGTTASVPQPRLARTDSPSETRSVRIFVFSCSYSRAVLRSIERDTGVRKTGGTGRLEESPFRRRNYGQFSRLDKALWNSTLMSFRPCMIVVILRPFVICLRAYNLFIHSLLTIFLMNIFFIFKNFFKRFI